MNIFEAANQYLAWNQHLAGWAQGVGGVAAIVAAFLIARGDRGAAIAAEERRQRILANGATVVAAQALDAVLAAAELVLDPINVDMIKNGGMDTDDVDSALDAIGAFPTHEFNNTAASLELALMTGQLKAMKVLLRHAESRIRDGVFEEEHRAAFAGMRDMAKASNATILAAISPAKQQPWAWRFGRGKPNESRSVRRST